MTVKSTVTEANKNQNIDISQSRLLAGIFESLPTALITVTHEGYIAEANAAANTRASPGPRSQVSCALADGKSGPAPQKTVVY